MKKNNEAAVILDPEEDTVDIFNNILETAAEKPRSNT